MAEAIGICADPGIQPEHLHLPMIFFLQQTCLRGLQKICVNVVHGLVQEMHRRDRGHRRTREVSDIPRDHEHRTCRTRHRRDDGILEVRQRKLPRGAPICGVEVASWKIVQHLIQRRFGTQPGRMLADELVQGRQSTSRTHSCQGSSGHVTQYLHGCRIMWFPQLKHVHQHIDVHGDGHECFFSRCSR